MLHRLAVLTVILFLIAMTSTAHAQGTATLSGEVKDSYGSVIPAADIIATNNATGAEVTGSTDAVGNYRLTLEPGTYTVTVEASGFEAATASDVEAMAGQAVVARLHAGTGGGHHLYRGGGQPCRAAIGDRVHRACGRHSVPRTSPARGAGTWQPSCGRWSPPSTSTPSRSAMRPPWSGRPTCGTWRPTTR